MSKCSEQCIHVVAASHLVTTSLFNSCRSASLSSRSAASQDGGGFVRTTSSAEQARLIQGEEWQQVCVCVSLCVCQLTCLPVYLSNCLPVHLSKCVCVCVCVCVRECEAQVLHTLTRERQSKGITSRKASRLTLSHSRARSHRFAHKLVCTDKI